MFTFPVGFFNPVSNSGGTTDPYAANVVLFLKGDGANGSTSIIDSSPNPKTISVVGNTQISTTQSKYGGSSIYFDGSAGYLTLPHNTDFILGVEDFTVESWVLFPTSSGSRFMNKRLTQGGSDGTWSFDVETGFIAFSEVISGEPGIRADVNLGLNTWHHIAVSRVSSVGYISVNGVIVHTATLTRNFNDASFPLVIGASVNEVYMTVYIDMLRLTKGVGRYTANFNPETDTYLNI